MRPYTAKKRKHVEAVKVLLENKQSAGKLTPFLIDESLEELFQNSKKQDDLADSLLQALTFANWLRNRRSFQHHIQDVTNNPPAKSPKIPKDNKRKQKTSPNESGATKKPKAQEIIILSD